MVDHQRRPGSHVRRGQFAGRPQVPDLDAAVETARGEHLAIRGECECENPAVEPLEPGDLAFESAPKEPDATTVSTPGEGLAVGREGDCWCRTFTRVNDTGRAVGGFTEA